MKRTILNQLRIWKQKPDKRPLIIKGARQVGKTYIIREFARTAYQDMVEINFERDLELKRIFEKAHKPKELLEYLQLSYLDKSFDSQTLLFMDEIQACPDALTALKFMAEEFPCDIICSGRLLGVAISRTSSYPMRYVETWEMKPMSFMEFLMAMGISEALLDQLREAVFLKIPLPEVLHEKMNELFKTYLIVGGMPEVVKKYKETKSYIECLRIQRGIVNDYLQDMVKYADGASALKIRECFASIPLQLAKENQKFQYSVVKKGYNARYYDASLKWLADSGLIIKVNRLSHIAKPITAQVELAVFKIFMADCGLFLSQLHDGDIKAILDDEMGIYQGALYENVVAQMLAQYHKTCYYYEPSQSTEIDFIVEYEGEITPIEVKAGVHTASISFRNYVKKYQPKQSYRFSKKNIGYDEVHQIHYFPLYTVEFLLEQEKQILQSE